MMGTAAYECVFVFFFCECEQKGACSASSKSMSPQGNVEPETKSERDLEKKGKDGGSSGQTHFAISLSDLSAMLTEWTRFPVKFVW